MSSQGQESLSGRVKEGSLVAVNFSHFLFFWFAFCVSVVFSILSLFSLKMDGEHEDDIDAEAEVLAEASQ